MIGILTLVYILGGDAPTTFVAPVAYTSPDQCEERLAEYNANPPTGTEEATGKPIVAFYADCVITFSSDVQKQLSWAIEDVMKEEIGQ